MNVYDFDGTIFYPNCTFKYAVWCILRHPRLLFTYVPPMLWQAAGYKLGRVPEYRFLRTFFSYLGQIPDYDREIEAFWDKNEKHIASWYLRQKKEDDLIISGSPECIVGPIAERLHVKIMATMYDRETGVFYGNLMLGKSKSRYVMELGLPRIDHFYSDSLSDTPIALCAEEAYLVRKRATTLTPWPALSEKNRRRIRRKIDNGWKYIDE